MSPLIPIVSIAAAGLALAACGTTPTAASGLAGALAFGKLGDQMTAQDKARAAEAVRGNPIGRTTTWTSENGRKFSATPTRASESTAGECRDYVLEGDAGQVKGSACRPQQGLIRSPGA